MEQAFSVAEKELGITRLLEPEGKIEAYIEPSRTSAIELFAKIVNGF